MVDDDDVGGPRRPSHICCRWACGSGIMRDIWSDGSTDAVRRSETDIAPKPQNPKRPNAIAGPVSRPARRQTSSKAGPCKTLCQIQCEFSALYIVNPGYSSRMRDRRQKVRTCTPAVKQQQRTKVVGDCLDRGVFPFPKHAPSPLIDPKRYRYCFASELGRQRNSVDHNVKPGSRSTTPLLSKVNLPRVCSTSEGLPRPGTE